MKIFQNAYSLTLGIIIGVLASLSALLVGVLAMVAAVYTETRETKTATKKAPKADRTTPIPTVDEVKESLSKDDIGPYRKYRGTNQKVGAFVNDVSDILSRNGYVTRNWVQERLGRSTLVYNGDVTGWTNDEFNINTIEMVGAAAGDVTLIMPEFVDISSWTKN